jgi:hypothetical protein
MFAELCATRRDELRREQGWRSGEIEPAFASWAALGGHALLQPLKPLIAPSERVLDRVGERQADLEAGS